jgi:TPR repeat protein
MFRLLLVSGLALGLTASAAALELGFADECALQAASPYDPATPAGQGVMLEDIAFETAIAACEAALSEAPDDPVLQYQLGRAHDAAGNFEQAIAQYSAALEAGHDIAAVSLAGLYELGLGVDEDIAEAVRLYQLAFERSALPIAAANLGYVHEQGVGVAADAAKAVHYYTIADAGGVSWATVSLGYLYETGQGVAADDAKAVALYQKAAKQGNADGLNNLGAAYEAGLGGLTPSIDRARSLYEQAAEGGSGMAHANLGDIHATGRPGIKADVARAESYYRTAIATGPALVTARAQNSLAWLLAVQGGDLAEAEDLASAALAHDGNDPATLDTMGWIKHLQGEDKAALVHLEAAARLKPATTQLAHLGDVQLALGNRDAAREAYQAALAAMPDGYAQISVDPDAIARWLADN